jgi:hypothetical protein
VVPGANGASVSTVVFRAKFESPIWVSNALRLGSEASPVLGYVGGPSDPPGRGTSTFSNGVPASPTVRVDEFGCNPSSWHVTLEAAPCCVVNSFPDEVWGS